MKKNMGTIDRALRFGLAVLVAILYFTGVISGTVAIVLGIIAVDIPAHELRRHVPGVPALRYLDA